MRKLIIAVVTVLALSSAALAAVNCATLTPCKFTGQLPGLDCSTRECPSIIAEVNQAGPLHAFLTISDGLACENPSDPADVVWNIPDAGGWILILSFQDGGDPPPGTDYSLGWLFDGCENFGYTCGGFTSGSPVPNCQDVNKDFPAIIGTAEN